MGQEGVVLMRKISSILSKDIQISFETKSRILRNSDDTFSSNSIITCKFLNLSQRLLTQNQNRYELIERYFLSQFGQ